MIELTMQPDAAVALSGPEGKSIGKVGRKVEIAIDVDIFQLLDTAGKQDRGSRDGILCKTALEVQLPVLKALGIKAVELHFHIMLKRLTRVGIAHLHQEWIG